ncbi:MAG: class I SAM-dependent methyltransferase [Candidatus Omnitrophica bacterium]|nr:class I SAM-dependent methyltransferase [Candidatus Omnitrophota bacterium]
MIKKFYLWLLKATSKPKEKNEYSKGHWQNAIREKVTSLCGGINGKILEVGCGEGLFLEHLAQEKPNLELWGIDNSQIRINEAQSKKKAGDLTNLNFAVEDATKLSFSDGSFEAVVCINVLFNLPSIELLKQVLKEMRRVCKTSGKIYFDFRNALNPLLFLKYRLAPFYDETVKDLPLKTYSQKQISDILKDLDIKIINKSYIGLPFKLFAPIVIIEAERC